MKRILMICLLCAISGAILSGCADIKVHTGSFLEIGNEKIMTDKPPCATAGIESKNYLQAREFVVVLPEFLIQKEWRTFRLSWDIIVIDDDGNLFFGVIVTRLTEKNFAGHFYGYGKVFLPDHREGNIEILSTRASLGFNAYGDGFLVDRNLLANNISYRKELAKKGTPLKKLSNAKNFDRIVAGWKYVYQTPFGEILSPWPAEIFVPLCTLNTGYNRDEAEVRDLKGNYNLFNPIGTIINGIQDIKVKLSAEPETSGWDINSPNLEKNFTDELIRERRMNAVIKEY